MSAAIIPSSYHNDIFLGESIDMNKTQYIEDYFANNEYYMEFTNIDINSLEERFIKSKYLIKKIYYILVEKILKEPNQQTKSLVYLQKDQLNDLIDTIIILNDPYFLYTKLFVYLETLEITQLIYLKQKLNFKKISEYSINKISVSSDKLYNIDNIKDMKFPIYNYLYYEDVSINNRNMSSNLKTKKDYIKKFYLDNNYYSIKENIIDYVKYIFDELYVDLSNINYNTKIQSHLFLVIIYILSQNNDWSYKLKWMLYYLNENQLTSLDK